MSERPSFGNPENKNITETARRVDETSFARHERGKNYDADFFVELTEQLDALYEASAPNEQHDLLMNRFFDAAGHLSADRKTQFEAHAGMRVPEIAESEFPLFGIKDFGSISERYQGLSFVERQVPRVFQYGPSRIVLVEPGCFVSMEDVAPQDVLGTNLLTSCTAIFLKQPNGMFLAHVRMSDPEAILKILDETPYEKGYIVTPERKMESSLDDEMNERVTSKIQDHPHIGVSRYPYIVHGMKNNPYGTHSTTVLGGENFIRSVGVKERFGKGKPGSRHLYFETIPESISDYAW